MLMEKGSSTSQIAMRQKCSYLQTQLFTFRSPVRTNELKTGLGLPVTFRWAYTFTCLIFRKGHEDGYYNISIDLSANPWLDGHVAQSVTISNVKQLKSTVNIRQHTSFFRDTRPPKRKNK